MAIALDILILVIFFSAVFSGLKKGFLVTVVETVGFFIAVGASIVFAKPLSVVLKGTGLYTTVYDGMKRSFSSLLDSYLKQYDLSNLMKEKPSGFVSLLQGFGTNIDKAGKSYEAIIASGVKNTADAFTNSIITPIADAVMTVIAFILILIVAIIVIAIVKVIFKGVSKLPVIGGFNKFAGFLVGIALGGLQVLVFCMLIGLLIPYLHGIGVPITPSVTEHTILFRQIAEKNPIDFYNFLK